MAQRIAAVGTINTVWPYFNEELSRNLLEVTFEGSFNGSLVGLRRREERPDVGVERV